MVVPNKGPSGTPPPAKGEGQGQDGTPPGSPPAKKSDETLLSGKYKTEEERDAAFKEGQRTLTEAQEKVQRAEDLLNAYLIGGGQGTPPANSDTPPTPNQPAGTPVSDYSNLLTNPTEVLAKVKDDTKRETLAEVDAHQSRLKVQEETKILFYQKNPKLVGNEIVVTHFANEISRTNPNLPLERAMEEVAKKASAYVGKIRDDGKPPPPAVGGGTSGTGADGRPNPEGEPPQPKKQTEEEILKETIATRNTNRTARK